MDRLIVGVERAVVGTDYPMAMGDFDTVNKIKQLILIRQKFTVYYRLARAVRPEAVGTECRLREGPGCLQHHPRWLAGGPQGTVPLPTAAGLTAPSRSEKMPD